MTQEVITVHPEADVGVAWKTVRQIKRKLPVSNLQKAEDMQFKRIKDRQYALVTMSGVSVSHPQISGMSAVG